MNPVERVARVLRDKGYDVYTGPETFDDFCYGHGRREPEPPGGFFMVCGECFHGWATVEDFERDVIGVCFEIGLGLTAHRIDLQKESVCPLCSHDF